MKLIVITSPESITDEAKEIAQLFDEGLELLHIRKPDWDGKRLEELLRRIPFVHYKKIVLHSHFQLCEKYNIKGVHLTAARRNELDADGMKELITSASKRNLSVSTSFHSLKEIQENKVKFNYAFLSPVFNSISKKEYKATFDREELKDFLSMYSKSTSIIALGGIDEVTIKEVERMKFSGAALLGVIWEQEGKAVQKFRKVKVALENE